LSRSTGYDRSPSADPGSPYKGSLNGLNGSLGFGRPNLSKELVQRLRSMTETIKMLSEENAELRKLQEEGPLVDVKRKGKY